MVDKEIIRTFKKPLLWVSIISAVVIVIMGLVISAMSSDLNSCYENKNEMRDTLYEDYDYKCEDGFKRICIGNDNYYSEYEKDEYSIIIGEDETYAVCDTDRREYATCLDEDKSWTQCDIGEYATCIDWDTERITQK